MEKKQRSPEERERLHELVLDTIEDIQGECVTDRNRLCLHISSCVARLDYAYEHMRIDEKEAVVKATEYAETADDYCEYGAQIDKDGRTTCNFGQTKHPRSPKK